MKSRSFNPSELDVAAFAKQSSELSGHWPLHELPRLSDSVMQNTVPPDSAPVSWRMQGELRGARDGAPQVWLHVAASTHVAMECQRCLKSVDLAVAIERSVTFIHGEDTAAELDFEGDDDVLAMTRALDTKNLIEDELLLALPLVPRHEICPQPLPMPEDVLPEAEDASDKPFAALASFKPGGLVN